MNQIYRAGPAGVPVNLTKPSSEYRRHAWLAVLGLTVFVVLYFMLTAWFGWTAYRLIAGAFEPGGDVFKGVASGLPAAFLAVFLAKAIFFVKRGKESNDIELTVDQEPKLFEFLNKIADEADAPRPHRVYISPRVNAAVFYDLSILNFIFPSRKNLEIGLGLVNVLNLTELKAVLAHEFGHFAQKSMAIGSWVYIAHQVAAHIIAQRDILDRFVQGLSRSDIRIAWIGWILGLVIWSIRSLIDTIFSIVIVAQRALSREMEFQADLVAVSLTGSDALIHALHKLHAADEAWDRTLSFVGAEANAGRSVSDVFEIQKRIIQRLRVILDNPDYGKAPPVPEDNAEKHRVFNAALASPPRMWATHPENSAREDNAKQQYIAAEADERSAWLIFEDATKIRSLMSAALLDESDLESIDIKDSITNIDKQFNKAYLSKKFQGAYLGRSITRYANTPDALYRDYKTIDDIDEKLAALYPKSLSDDLEKIRNLYEEKYALEGIQAKTLRVSGGVIRHRDKEIRKQDIPGVLKELKTEIEKAEKIVQARDIDCRTAHLALAHHAGKGWEGNLLGLLELLHYADHCEANLRDAQGYLSNVVAVITADDRVSKSELKRLLVAAGETYEVLSEVYQQAEQVELGHFVGKQLDVASWKESLGEFNLPGPSKENINDWINVIDNWLGVTINSLSAVGAATLEQLLTVEAFVLKHRKDQTELPKAPVRAKVPSIYSTLVEGQERQRQTKLGLWDRFYTADGFLASSARFAVAASIVGAVVFAGYFAGGANVTIYNGLANTVEVDISGQSVRLAAFQHANLLLPPASSHVISTTLNGHLVEKFDAKTSRGFGKYVYNVSNATSLVEWTQTYGNARERPDKKLGAPRWITTSAQVLFEEPPESVSTKSGGATRTVLHAFGNAAPRDILEYVDDPDEQHTMIRQHVVWDSPDSTHINRWIRIAIENNDINALMAERLQHYQHDMIAMRALQDYATDESSYKAICTEHQKLAEHSPDQSNLQYLAIRCMEDTDQQDRAFIEGAKRWPDNGWFHYAAAYTYTEQGDWDSADKSMLLAMQYSQEFRDSVSVDLLRLQRMQGKSSVDSERQLSRNSQSLTTKLRLESGEGLDDSPYRFYALLNKGDLEAAKDVIGEMGDAQARGLRLLAASDGASPELIEAAQRLKPEQGVDPSTVLLGWSLAVKVKQNSQPFEKAANNFYPKPELMFSVLDKVKKLGAYSDIESDMKGLGLVERGYTYAAASLLLGNNAPLDWKNKATKLLFATERPYFYVD